MPLLCQPPSGDSLLAAEQFARSNTALHLSVTALQVSGPLLHPLGVSLGFVERLFSQITLLSARPILNIQKGV